VFCVAVHVAAVGSADRADCAQCLDGCLSRTGLLYRSPAYSKTTITIVIITVNWSLTANR